MDILCHWFPCVLLRSSILSSLKVCFRTEASSASFALLPNHLSHFAPTSETTESCTPTAIEQQDRKTRGQYISWEVNHDPPSSSRYPCSKRTVLSRDTHRKTYRHLESGMQWWSRLDNDRLSCLFSASISTSENAWEMMTSPSTFRPTSIGCNNNLFIRVYNLWWRIRRFLDKPR